MGTALLVMLALSSAQSETFIVDAAKSMLVVRTWKAGFAKGRGHDHAIRAVGETGKIRHGADPDGDSVELEVPTTGLVVDDKIARDAAQLGEGPSPDDRAKIEKTMRGDGQLDVEKYPSIRFESTSVKRKFDDTLLVTGNLTLHGKTRPVTVSMHVTVSPSRLVADGTFEILQSDYGIKPYSAFLGAVKNEDKLTFILHVVATN